MKKPKLVVGKTYLSRNDLTVKIIKRDDWNVNYPFQDENGEEYNTRGVSIRHYGIIKCGFDLLKKKPKLKKPKLVVGETYLSRNDLTVKIIKRDDWNVNYPFQDENGEEYDTRGVSIRQYGIIECGFDLLKKVTL